MSDAGRDGVRVRHNGGDDFELRRRDRGSKCFRSSENDEGGGDQADEESGLHSGIS
jgi:hypothetical protein